MTATLEQQRPQRLVGLDAYRGLIMLAMASGGFAFPAVAKHFPDSPLWQSLGHQASHRPGSVARSGTSSSPRSCSWSAWCCPSRSPAVVPQGQSWARLFGHALLRSLVLIALAVFLSSTGTKTRQTNFIFTNVLAQIGLGYMVVFLLVGRSPRVQLATALAILAGYWLLFAAYPLPSPGFDRKGWDSRERAGSAGVLRSLGHEYKRRGGVRPLVPQPVPPARQRSVPVQRRGLRDAQLHTLDRHDDLRPSGGRGRAERAPRRWRRSGRWCWPGPSAWWPAPCSTSRSARSSSGSGPLRGPSTAPAGPLATGVLLRSGRRGGLAPLGVPAGRGRCQLDRHVRDVAALEAVRREHVADPPRHVLDPLATAPAVDRLVYERTGTHLDPRLFAGLYGPTVRRRVLLVLWLACLWMYRQRIFVKI